MLRAAYFGQELLSTFGTAIGEIALIPATGGLFQVTLTHKVKSGEEEEGIMQEILLWDRKTEGGFPETKVLKQRLRDHIQPERDLGHSDKKKHVSSTDVQEVPRTESTTSEAPKPEEDGAQAVSAGKKDNCEDCK